MDSYVASHPPAQGSIPSIPKNFSEELFILDVAEVNVRRCCLEQWTAEA